MSKPKFAVSPLPTTAARWPIPLTLALTTLLALVPQPTLACKGDPPKPFCGKTLVLAMAAPPVALITGGGILDVPLTTYFNIFDFPPGAGLCPPEPFSAAITLTATCTTSTGAVGGTTVTLTPGAYTNATVSLTFAAGPPRLCTIAGTATATATLADGMVMTAVGESVLCIADPAPGNPLLPRLDLLPLNPLLGFAHPGDQSSFRYRITNNDPLETYTGDLVIETRNSSRRPAASGPAAPGTGVFSISNPLQGDNFPIALGVDLNGSCLPLPPNPLDPAIPQLIEQILLLPGESTEVEVVARSWGMCSDGSCSQGKLVLDGFFSDTSQGRACSAFVAAADTSVSPLYLWPDSGQTAFILPPADPQLGVLTLAAEPFAGLPVAIDAVIQQPQLFVQGNPLPIPPGFFAAPLHDGLGRSQILFLPQQGSFPADSFFDVFFDIELPATPGQPLLTELRSMELTPGAPTGFEDTAPFAEGEIALVDPQTGVIDSFFDITYQISGTGIDEDGQRRRVVFSNLDIRRRGDGSGFSVALNASLEPGTGSQIIELEIDQDWNGYASAFGASIFVDGFESGDTAEWSSSLP